MAPRVFVFCLLPLLFLGSQPRACASRAGERVLLKRTYVAGEHTTYRIELSISAFDTASKTVVRQTAVLANGAEHPKLKFEVLDYVVTGPADSGGKPVDFATDIGSHNGLANIPFQQSSSTGFIYVFLGAAQLTPDSEVQTGDVIPLHWKPEFQGHSLLVDGKGTITSADQHIVRMKLAAPVTFDGQAFGTLTLDEEFDATNGRLRSADGALGASGLAYDIKISQAD